MARVPFNGTPIIGPDGTIYAVAGKATERYLDDGAALYAVWPDGRQKWVCVPDLGIWGDPLMAPHGVIYIQATFTRRIEGGETLDMVMTIDPETGKLIAPKPLNINAHGLIMDTRGIFYYFPDMDFRYMMAVTAERDVVWATEELGWPVVDPQVIGPDRTVYVCVIALDDQDYLYALGDGGSTRWRRELTAQARLAIDGHGILVVWQYDGVVQALTSDGSRLWEHALGAPNASVPAFGPDGEVYLCTADGRIVLVARDGAFRWQHPAPSRVTGGPRAAADGTCYFGCADRCIYALDSEGMIRWRHWTGGEIHSVPAIGADGTVYVGSDDGCLYALRPDGVARWRFAATIERSTTAE